ncbi:helix-turn-helix domain-containing protein [Nonomuraea sp. NPDC003804]|uniref:helix-turn-helix domain-containing protein n=1 Tax=Nonomuraea sp. NPDC003804 TaxID=3154547 RepID=UPI0033B8BE50
MHPRDTVDRALSLSAHGVSDREVAARCGVSVGAVRKWRTGERRARDEADRRRRRDCPRCHDRPMDVTSYAQLLGLYLGDGHLALGRKGVYRLSISCADDWPGLIEETASVMSRVMPTSAVHRRSRRGGTEVTSQSTHWACLFPQHGPGPKHLRAIVLVPWQKEIVEAHPGRFVRGLMHADGCRGVNRVRRVLPSGVRWYEYPRYHFKNESADILRLCGEALDLLRVAWRYSNRNDISVARREAVARLDLHVGPKY